MLFNKGDKFSYAEIKKATNIPEAELERHILSLAHPKVRLLKKTPNNKSLADDHTFEYNTQYTSQLRRVKIPVLSASKAKSGKEETKGDELEDGDGQEPTGEGGESNENVPAGVLEARKSRVEAAIVRVMKARKTLEHNNLVSEVVKQLSNRFAVEPAFIKKRIDALIEREYLERDSTDRRLYHYLA